MTNYKINDIVYCNSKTIIAEKCRINSLRKVWHNNKHQYGYLVCSLNTKEVFMCPEECLYPTAYMARQAVTDKHRSVVETYKSSIHTIDDLLNFAFVQMQNTKKDEAALSAFADKAKELFGVALEDNMESE